MIAPTEASIAQALGNLRIGLERYQWLQANIHGRDVGTDREFQRRFNGYYRVRRAPAWQRVFFPLLERAKTTSTDYGTVLRTIYASTGRVEASFASKLIATVEPAKPVIDQY